MMSKIVLLGVLLIGITAHRSPAQRLPTDAQLREAALRIAALDARRQLPSATLATIDSLLAFYADSVVYEHPNVGATVRGKAAMRAGMAQYLGSVRIENVQVPRLTVGPSVVVLDMPAQPDPRHPAEAVPATRHAIRILEFDARGLVRRIIDYPW